MYAIPPPAPPSVYAGLMINGSPSSSITSSASFKDDIALLRGTFSPMRSIVCLNNSRSSVFLIASRGVPNSSTPYFSKTPISASSLVILSPVWPPIPAIIPSGRSFSMIFATTFASIGSMYTASAISGSVMIVAGFEFTSTTFKPSSFNDLHA